MRLSSGSHLALIWLSAVALSVVRSPLSFARCPLSVFLFPCICLIWLSSGSHLFLFPCIGLSSGSHLDLTWLSSGFHLLRLSVSVVLYPLSAVRCPLSVVRAH